MSRSAAGQLAAGQPAASSSSLRPGPTHQKSSSRASPYSPALAELHGGPKNRLFLALRSGIPDEIDWALPRLVVGSYENQDKFRLDQWVDSVGILQAWPEKWISDLERLSAVSSVQDGTSSASRTITSSVPEWTIDPATERRATESLLVLRNASLSTGNNNAQLICRQSFLGLLERFFALPIDFLIDVTVRYPEPVAHILSVLHSILPYVQPLPDILHIFSTVLPRLLIETRDQALMTLLLPVLITTCSITNLPPLPLDLVPHLFMLLTLKPPSPLIDLTLDLLVTLSQHPVYARQILCDKHITPYLRALVPLLEYAAKPFAARWDSAPSNAGKVLQNPASLSSRAEEASRRREREREDCQRHMESGGLVDVPVGESPPILPQSIKKKLYEMSEPERSIKWMHETFVYSSRSQLLQVTFWHAYRDFFTHPSTVDQLLSASEVIKNVTIAFPGASAKVWTDSTGQQKFVIAGMGFRRGSDDDNAFPCQWQGCLVNFSGKSPADLYSHVLGSHIRLEQPPLTCAWGSCRLPFDPTRLEDHVATHFPTSPPISVPDTLTVHPSVPDYLALHSSPLHHPPAPLPRSVKLSFMGQITPCDSRRQPTGPSFLTALVLRNLARSLRTEIALATPVSEDGESGAGGLNGAEKKKHLLEERYGLPIPDSVLREEEEEERNAEKDEEDLMSAVQRDRAVLAFQQVEDKVLEVMESNMVGLATYLSSAVGW